MASDQITQETLEMAKAALQNPLAKDATTQGYTTNTGLTGYNLEAPSKSLFPVLAPFRNSVPRIKQPKGATAAHWKGIMKINATNRRATTKFGYAGNTVSTQEKDFLAPYKVISLGDTVGYDAQIQAQEFQDLRATAGMNLLYALMEQEDIILLGGQAFSLGTVSTPSATQSSTGGTIGAVTPSIAVAARTMQGYYDGQGTAASAAYTFGAAFSGANNSITATVSDVRGAVVYDWFVGTSGGTLYYYGSSTTNTIKITSIPTAGATSSGVTADCSIPMSYTVDSSGNVVATTLDTAAKANTDNSADDSSSNGLIATLTGDYISGAGFGQYGSGVATGAYYKSLGGSGFTGVSGTVDEIDAALDYLWANAKVSPDTILMNSIDHKNLSDKIISSGGAYTLFRPDDVSERQAVVGGQLVETYINKSVNGRAIALETHPWLPQGTVLGVTKKLPYPNNKVANVLEVETLLEYQQIEYATSRREGQANGGPRYDFEVRAQEAFKNYFPGAMFCLQNVGNA